MLIVWYLTHCKKCMCFLFCQRCWLKTILNLPCGSCDTVFHLENEVKGSQNFEEVLTQKYEIYNRCHSREECSNFANEDIAYKLHLFSTLF